MKRLLILIFICHILFLSCTRDVMQTENLKARVLNTKDLSCSMPVLSFEEDSVRINLITGKKAVSYGVTQLPDSLNVEGKTLYVSVKLLAPEEEFACNTLGLAYPHLKIISAKER